MTGDARFEEGAQAPLRLIAQDKADVPVISALVQDAVFPVTEMTWNRPAHRFALLLNRFRWEDRASAERQRRPFERVRALLLVGGALQVASSGFDRNDPDLVLSLLSIGFEPGQDGAGEMLLTLAGEGAIRLSVECLDLALRDVTRPYRAPSGKAPRHED